MTLECILLIDDDKATNFIHQRIIKKSGIDIHIQVAENGKEALEFLTNKASFNNNKYPKPGLIFLDINMPVMNGWEFLEEYENLPENQKANMVLAMLTTSLNPDDKSKAEQINDLKGFVNKPLSEEVILKLIEDNFNK